MSLLGNECQHTCTDVENETLHDGLITRYMTDTHSE